MEIKIKARSDGHDCPYNNLPERAFFRSAPLRQGNLLIDPQPDFHLTPESRVISAGSCFAARIATFIHKSGINYLAQDDRNPAHAADIQEEAPHLFSLRYGNLYTARHLMQLLQRVTGQLVAEPATAVDKKGRYRNLFRPSVFSYTTLEALRADDVSHLTNARALISQADIFMFTLGLSEQWLDSETGLAMPSTPGCGYGAFEDARHSFHNSSLAEVRDELLQAFTLLESLNPKIKILLTLSPVPLVATYEKTSAVEATFYSKSLLRQAIDEAIKKWPRKNITYFPSYEIITNPHVIKENFEDDMRGISEAGVARVLSHFGRCYLSATKEPQSVAAEPAPIEITPTLTTIIQPFSFGTDAAVTAAASVDPVCDEENILRAYLNKEGK